MSENINFVQSYIKNVLYPEKLYSRTAYLGIDKHLISYFLSYINNSNKKKKIFQSGNTKKLQTLIDSVLSFDQVLKNNPHLIVLMHKGFIERYVKRYQRNRDLHDDIIQEVLTRLLQTNIYRICDNYNNNFKKIPFFILFFGFIATYLYRGTKKSKY